MRLSRQIDISKKLAVPFIASTDRLTFEEGECDPQDDLKLRFEAVAQMMRRRRRLLPCLMGLP